MIVIWVLYRWLKSDLNIKKLTRIKCRITNQFLHKGDDYVGNIDYADDVAIVAPSLQGLKHMVITCEGFAIEYNTIFNQRIIL